jgi:hypothetical protein
MKPYRLAWFRSNIGNTIKRRDFTMHHKFVEIFIKDSWKAQQLFKTQFDICLRYSKK